MYANWDRILGLHVYEPGFSFGVCVNKLRLNFYSSVYIINLCFGLLHETCCIKHHHWDTAVGLKRKHAIKILIIKQLNALISHIYFWNKILRVSESSSVHHQEFFTVHAAMAYWFRPDPARKLSANLYDTYYCCVYSEKLLIMDRETVRNMYSFIPK